MRKMFKRIAALSAAVMMIGTMAVSASATNEYGSYQYGSSPKVSGSVWTSTGSRKAVSASTTNGGTNTVSAHVVITYKNTSGVAKTYGNGNSGKGNTGVTVVMPENGTYQYSTNTHKRGTYTLGSYRLYL